MLNIVDIQSLYESKAVVLTEHFLNRIKEREIKLIDIKTAIMNGDIIEQYPFDYPHPSALIYGHTGCDDPLHIVVGMGDGIVWLITAYFPSLGQWETNFKSRKVDK